MTIRKTDVIFDVAYGFVSFCQNKTGFRLVYETTGYRMYSSALADYDDHHPYDSRGSCSFPKSMAQVFGMEAVIIGSAECQTEQEFSISKLDSGLPLRKHVQKY